jgi:hypothetical protein
MMLGYRLTDGVNQPMCSSVSTHLPNAVTLVRVCSCCGVARCRNPRTGLTKWHPRFSRWRKWRRLPSGVQRRVVWWILTRGSDDELPAWFTVLSVAQLVKIFHWRWEPSEILPCSLVRVDRRFIGYHPDDGGSTRLWKVSLFQGD